VYPTVYEPPKIRTQKIRAERAQKNKRSQGTTKIAAGSMEQAGVGSKRTRDSQDLARYSGGAGEDEEDLKGDGGDGGVDGGGDGGRERGGDRDGDRGGDRGGHGSAGDGDDDASSTKTNGQNKKSKLHGNEQTGNDLIDDPDFFLKFQGSESSSRTTESESILSLIVAMLTHQNYAQIEFKSFTKRERQSILDVIVTHDDPEGTSFFRPLGTNFPSDKNSSSIQPIDIAVQDRDRFFSNFSHNFSEQSKFKDSQETKKRRQDFFTSLHMVRFLWNYILLVNFLLINIIRHALA